MRNVTISVAAGRGGRIALGRRGENEAARIVFDVAELAGLYGDGTAELVATRPGETAPYPVAAERDGSQVIWTVSSADTAFAGHGACELFWYVGDTLAKSVVYGTVVGRDIGDVGEEPPEPYETWVEQVLSAAAEARRASGSTDIRAEAETLPAGSDASVEKTVEPATGAVTLTFGIPRGDTGAKGDKGDKGDTGDTGPQGAKGDTGETGAQGPKGDKGDTGNTGAAGPGVPAGGTAGQFLVKASAADYDAAWVTLQAWSGGSY